MRVLDRVVPCLGFAATLSVATVLWAQGSPSGASQCSGLGYTGQTWNGWSITGALTYEYPGTAITAKVGLLGNSWGECFVGTPQGDGSCQRSDIGFVSASGRRITFGGWNWTVRHRWFWPNNNDFVETGANCPPQPPCGGDPGCSSSPILIPTTGLIRGKRALEVSGPDKAVFFDIDGDDVPERITWPIKGAAFLALDRNRNGLIDNGKELFGTANGHANGFDDLIATSGSTRGYLDRSDPIWSELRLWHDRNRDGISQPSELEPLDGYLLKIGLGFDLTDDVDQHGNRFRWKGWAEYRLPGNPKHDNDFIYPIYDVIFVRVD